MTDRNTNQDVSESDWDTFTVLRKRKTTADDFKRNQREGKTEAVAKSGVDGATAHKNYKLDQSSEAEKIERVPRELAQSIVKARTGRKLSQDALAKQLNVKVTVVKDIENGKAPFKNNRDLQKIKRLLGVK